MSSDHYVNLPTSGAMLLELKMPSRPFGKRTRGRKRKAAAVEGDGEEGDGGEGEGDPTAEEATGRRLYQMCYALASCS